MTQTFLSKLFRREPPKPPTPDEQLAEAIRKAIAEYNSALDAATRAGLSVMLETVHDYGTREYIYERNLKVSHILRTKRVKL